MARPRTRPPEVLMKYLHLVGPSSLVELALATGLKARTVARALSGMKVDGLVVAVPYLDEQGVKRVTWEAAIDDWQPAASQARRWLGARQWRRTEMLARTSVFDTRGFTQGTDEDGQ